MTDLPKCPIPGCNASVCRVGNTIGHGACAPHWFEIPDDKYRALCALVEAGRKAKEAKP